MTLKGKSKIYQHGKAATLYLSIPSSMAVDSAFPFKAGDVVHIENCGGEIVVRKRGAK